MNGKIRFDLNALAIYARVAEALSFSEAARRLDMPISTVSRKVADLEDSLGVQLIERSTRKLRLTDIGVEVLYEAQRSVETAEAIDAMVSNRLAEVSGRISLSAPPSIADSLLAPLLSAFQSTHPQVIVQVMVTDRFVDHIAEGIDLALRVGELKDSALVATPLLKYRRQLVASPEYLARHDALEHPHDLLGHRVLAFGPSVAGHRWSFYRGDETETVEVRPVLAMNDYAGLAQALADGNGVGDLPPIVRPELMSTGKLVELIPDWRLSSETLSLVRLGNRHVPKAIRAFIDFATTRARQMFPGLPQ
ncbi:MAG: LysR family transcriptional regulator [Gammaproteobacteria bacterium]|nr:LysR family transcriptional regulator [Gammaproteobacteria bacterium]